jgi:hypothetical protein
MCVPSELEIIIKHFDKYPLLSQKHVDFILFKLIVYIINKKESNTYEGRGLTIGAVTRASEFY